MVSELAGMVAVIERRAARQVQTTPNRQERWEQRNEAIQAALALGLPYRVTPLAVIVGQSPKRAPKPAPTTPTVVTKLHKRKVLLVNPPSLQRSVFGAVPRVQRASKADIEW
jgi:hypothetical protein